MLNKFYESLYQKICCKLIYSGPPLKRPKLLDTNIRTIQIYAKVVEKKKTYSRKGHLFAFLFHRTGLDRC